MLIKLKNIPKTQLITSSLTALALLYLVKTPESASGVYLSRGLFDLVIIDVDRVNVRSVPMEINSLASNQAEARSIKVYKSRTAITRRGSQLRLAIACATPGRWCEGTQTCSLFSQLLGCLLFCGLLRGLFLNNLFLSHRQKLL